MKNKKMKNKMKINKFNKKILKMIKIKYKISKFN